MKAHNFGGYHQVQTDSGWLCNCETFIKTRKMCPHIKLALSEMSGRAGNIVELPKKEQAFEKRRGLFSRIKDSIIK